MTEKASAEPTREERLAAKLRENLRRRKAQGRELDDTHGALLPEPRPKPGLSKPEGRG